MSTRDPYDDDELLDDELRGEDDDDMFARRERERSRHSSRVVGDLFRRAIENTVGQVERSGAIPKDALSYLIHQGDKGRREIVRIVANEVGDFLKHTDISSEVVKILTNVQVDMNASIRFKRNPEGRLTTEVEEGSEVSVTGTAPEPSRTKDLPVEEEED